MRRGDDPGVLNTADGGSRWESLANDAPWFLLAVPYLVNREMFYPPSLDWPPALWVAQSPYWGFVIVCFLVAIAFRSKRAHDSKALFALDTVSGAAMVISAFMVHSTVLQPTPWLAFAGMILCGASAAWQYARWGQCLAGIDLRRAVACICGGFVLAGILKCLFFVIPLVRVVVCAALVALAVVAMRRCLENTEGERPMAETGGGETLRLSDLWLIPVAIVLLSSSIGIMYAARYTTFGSSGGFQILLGAVLEMLAAATVWFWVCVRRRSLGVIDILAAMAAVVATSCTLIATLGGLAAGLAFFLTSIDYSLLTLFVWVLATALAGKVDEDPRFVFSTAWLFCAAPVLAGGCFAKASMLTLDPATCAVLMYVACMTLVAVIAGHNVSTTRVFSGLSAKAPADKTGLAQKCRELTESYHLTAREAEVLELLASGRTRPYIAESLCISENTVRVYTSKIYNKLDIHDRSSLFMLVYGPSSVPGADASEQ